MDTLTVFGALLSHERDPLIGARCFLSLPSSQIDASGGFLTHGWGDSLVLALAVKTFSPPKRVAQFLGLAYEHGSHGQLLPVSAGDWMLRFYAPSHERRSRGSGQRGGVQRCCGPLGPRRRPCSAVRRAWRQGLGRRWGLRVLRRCPFRTRRGHCHPISAASMSCSWTSRWAPGGPGPWALEWTLAAASEPLWSQASSLWPPSLLGSAPQRQPPWREGTPKNAPSRWGRRACPPETQRGSWLCPVPVPRERSQQRGGRR